jgi:S-adenosylmethionine-dependent methyltransferase
MSDISAKTDNERFQSGADKYAEYLETPEGRLRLDLSFLNLQEFLPQLTRPLRALDLGCGTGALGVRLALLGVEVTLLDSSLQMLDHAKRAAKKAGVTDKTALRHGDADEIADLFQSESFDIILCHNVLEYLHDPETVLRAAAGLLRDSSSLLSLLVRNQAGEVFKAAIQAGDLAAAESGVDAEWGEESLYGGPVRLFTPDRFRALVGSTSLVVAAERGVRVVSDYLPKTVSRDKDYERIIALDRKLGSRAPFAAIARYTQYFLCRTPAVNGGTK